MLDSAFETSRLLLLAKPQGDVHVTQQVFTDIAGGGGGGGNIVCNLNFD